MKDMGTNILPIDIYFENEDGEKFDPKTSMTIKITLPGGYENPIICYLPKSGIPEMLKSSVSDGRISFETNHDRYYVLAEKVKNSGAADDSVSRKPGAPESKDDFPAKTGDNSMLFPWWGILGCPGIALYLLIKKNFTSKGRN